MAFEGAKGVNQSTHFPRVTPIRDRNIIWKSVVRVGTMPWRHKPGSDQCRRNTGFFCRSPSSPIPGARMLTLIGSEHLQLSGISLKPCQLARMHYPAVLNGGQQFGWCVSKVIGFAGLWVGDDFFVPRFEEPATAGRGELFIQPRHRLTEINRFVDHLPASVTGRCCRPSSTPPRRWMRRWHTAGRWWHASCRPG